MFYEDTHFILVDDGTEDRWDTECDLRARLEAQLGTSCGVGSIVMRCVIAVEGGPGTLEGITLLLPEIIRLL